MFDVGFWEMFLILMLALLVIGPERLPGAARGLGRWVGKIRRYVEGVKSEVEQEFDVSELKKVLSDQKNQIDKLQQQVSSSVDVEALSSAAKFNYDNEQAVAQQAADEISDSEIFEESADDAVQEAAKKE